MRRVVISGRPSPLDIRTGADLTSLFQSFEVKACAQDLARVQLRAFAELEELTAEVAE